VFSHCRFVWLSQTNVPVVFLEPGNTTGTVVWLSHVSITQKTALNIILAAVRT
jgi:hypothetical protein